MPATSEIESIAFCNLDTHSDYIASKSHVGLNLPNLTVEIFQNLFCDSCCIPRNRTVFNYRFDHEIMHHYWKKVNLLEMEVISFDTP